MLILIFKCILVFQIQIIDFTNNFSQEDIPSGDLVFFGLPGDYYSNGGKCGVVIILNKILCIYNTNPHASDIESYRVVC